MKPYWYGVGFALTSILVTIVAFWAYTSQRSVLIEPDAAALFAPVQGLYAPEENPAERLRYRWSAGDATLMLPNPGGRLLLDLRLLAGPTTEQQIELTLDETAFRFALAPGVRRYYLVSGPHNGEQVALHIRSPSAEVNNRLLGTGLSSIALRGGGSVPWGVLLALVGLLLAGFLGGWRVAGLAGLVALAFACWLGFAGGWRYGLLYEGSSAATSAALLTMGYRLASKRPFLAYGATFAGAFALLALLAWLVLPPVVAPLYGLALALAATGCFALLMQAGWPLWVSGLASALFWLGTAVAAPLLVGAAGMVALALIFLGCAAGAAVIAERRVPSIPMAPALVLGLQRADWLPLLGVLGASLFVRLPWLAAPDPVGDLEIAAARVGRLWQSGLAGAYDPPGDYMPLRLYILSGIGALAALLGQPPSGQLTPLLTVLIKLPQLLADLITPMLIFAWSRSWLPARRAALVAALYALAPPVWINVSWWGQVDALLMLPMLLAVMLFEHGRGRWSWLCWVVALLIKPQAIILAPLMYVVTLRRYGCRGLVEGAGLGAGVAGLAMLPLILAGQLGNLVTAYAGSVGRFPRATAGAYNLWYLWLGPVARDRDAVLGSLSARSVGFLLLGLVVALICGALWLRSDGPGRARAAALLALAFFCLPTQIHERYMFLALAFLTLSMAPNLRWTWLWLWAVFAGSLNILAELSGFVPLIDATLGRSPIRYVIAAGNLVALVVGIGWLWRQGAGDKPSASTGSANPTEGSANPTAGSANPTDLAATVRL
jgi:hypothetical protein